MIKAKFKGQPGSAGYMFGNEYYLDIQLSVLNGMVTITPPAERFNLERVKYSNWKKFNENWDIPEHIKAPWDALLKEKII